MSTFWQITLGIFGGGIITLVVSWVFYVRAARGLERESARLRRHTTLILRGLEDAGLAEYHRDDQGEIVGMMINLSGISGGTSSATGSLSVTRQEEAQDREDQDDG